MAVYFWYLVKSELSSVGYCTVAYTSVVFYKAPEQHGQVYVVCTLCLVMVYHRKNYANREKKKKKCIMLSILNFEVNYSSFGVL